MMIYKIHIKFSKYLLNILLNKNNPFYYKFFITIDFLIRSYKEHYKIINIEKVKSNFIYVIYFYSIRQI